MSTSPNLSKKSLKKTWSIRTFGVSWAETTSKKEPSLPLFPKAAHPLDLSPENSATSSFYFRKKVENQEPNRGHDLAKMKQNMETDLGEALSRKRMSCLWRKAGGCWDSWRCQSCMGSHDCNWRCKGRSLCCIMWDFVYDIVLFWGQILKKLWL